MIRPWLAILCAAAAWCAGCGSEPSLGVCGSTLQPCCDGSCATGLFCESGTCRAPLRSPIDLHFRTKVDVLFMVDDSPSMEPMALELRNRFPQFFQVFADLAKSSFYADLHIGVVTSDFGAGATGAPGCDHGGGGRMGRFQAIGKNAALDCLRPVGADYVQYAFGPNGDGPSNLPMGQSLIKTFTCMASVGAKGCGMEHQLESVHYALRNPPAGFLRDDALLAVVFVTNEDDCSAPFDTDLFDETRVAEFGFLASYRCTRFGVVHGTPPALFPYADSGGPLAMTAPAPNPNGMGPGKLWDLSRYVDLFSKPAAQGGIKADPNDVVLVGIDAPADPAAVILSDPNSAVVQPVLTPCGPLDEKGNPPCAPVLSHSCASAKNAGFFGDPAIRLNAVIQSVAQNSLSPICDDDFSPALANLGRLIAAQLGLGCVGDALPPDPSRPGEVLADCLVTDVTQANGMTSVYTFPRCADPPAYPCWRLEKKAACAGRSPQGLGITIDRNGTPAPPNANIKASCKTVGR